MESSKLEHISNLSHDDVGETEENVKQKFVVPLLESLGHKKEDLSFEHSTRDGGRIDIFISKGLPQDSKVIIDTKKYSEHLDLDDHVKQIERYTNNEHARIAILANGEELRRYSPLPGLAFERCLLYIMKRNLLNQEEINKILIAILSYVEFKK